MVFHSTNKIWKKDETAALIALYETERCLYDSNERDFHDVNKKIEAYQRICKIMLRIRPDVTVDEIKYKIKVLRKQYEGELLHRNVSLETGLCSTDSYKPGMWCFGLLQFLDDHIQPEEETNRNDDDSDKEIFHSSETDHQKDDVNCSDAADESDDQDHEDVEERVSFKKRKIENSSTTSSSSSGRESLNSSIRKFLKSTSESKHQNSSTSVKKYKSASTVERKHQNSSTSAKKLHSNFSSTKKNSKPSPSLKKSQDTPPSYKKTQNAFSSHKKVANSSIRKQQSAPSSERKIPSSFKFERERKSSSERESKKAAFEKESRNSSMEREPKNYSSRNSSVEREPKNYSSRNSSVEREPKNYSSENHVRNSTPERISKISSAAAAKEVKISSLEKELFNASFSEKQLDILEKNPDQKTVDREDIFGRYVACELRALRGNPLIYLHTKQTILESLTSANFELINPE